MIEDCVRRILPSRYYNVDEELMRRKAMLMYEIIGEIARVETVTASPELVTDHDNCRPDISDRCGRPRVVIFQADEGYLFLDHMYATSYNTAPKRRPTSFAITRDFFHSLFGVIQDDLDLCSDPREPQDDNVRDSEGNIKMQDVKSAEAPSSHQQLPLQPEVTYTGIALRHNSSVKPPQRDWYRRQLHR